LMRRGFDILTFVHDCFDVAVDPRQAQSQCKQIEKVMVESMEQVIGQSVPVAADGELSDRWTKG
jgi:DNA polymerase I-like protein with 3'-5' exonuclease and polymerase domains